MPLEKENSVPACGCDSLSCRCFLPLVLACYLFAACILALHVLFNIGTEIVGDSARQVQAQLIPGLSGAAACNILFVLTLTAASFGGYLLCRKVSGSDIESFLGGLIFGFSPFFQTEISNGMISKAAGLALLPYFLITLLNLNRTLSPRWALDAAVVCWVAEICRPFSAVPFMVLLVVFLFAGWLNVEPQGRRGLLLRYMFVMIAVAVPLVLVPAVCCVHVPGNAEMSAKYVNIFRLVTYPGEGEWARFFPAQAGLMPFNIYTGKLVVLFVLLAYLVAGKQHRLWKLGFALFLVISLGSYLNRDFMSVTMLFGAVLAAIAFKRLMEPMFPSAKARILVVGFLGWLILADFSVSDPRNKGLVLPTVSATPSSRVIK